MDEQFPGRRALTRRAGRWALDIATIVGAWVLAFVVRFDFAVEGPRLSQLLDTLPWIVLLKVTCLSALWVHKSSWQYVGMRDVFALLRAMVAASSLLLAVRIVAGELTASDGFLGDAIVPYTVIAADFAFATLGLAALRIARRAQSESREQSSRTAPETRHRTLIVGAGRAGAMLTREIASRPDLGRTIVGLVDDDATKHGQRIHGVQVLGGTADLPRIVEDRDADDVIIAIASASGEDIRRISAHVESAGLSAQIVPGLYEIVDGQVNLSRIRPVAIEDLLRRDPIELDVSGIQRLVADDVVVVTGAGGSIGSELCRQLARFTPRAIVMVERAETALWAIHRELSATHPDVELVRALADVRDRERIDALMLEHRPAVVFHAAAHKHVPMCEANPDEAVRNNVLGTRVVADAARSAGVERFVLVSTDKAVAPSSVMGATKRLAERHVGAVAAETGLPYVSVRFGNVLGSNGSVVPIFREQIAAGGPITVTHRDMTRYFMTIPEACQLVIQAAAMGTAGDLFVLDMGDPVRIVDLAEDLVRLSGLEPHVDIAIEFTGIRDGEKLHEVLAWDHEALAPTANPHIRRRPDTRPASEPAVVEVLTRACSAAVLADVADELGPIVVDDDLDPSRA